MPPKASSGMKKLVQIELPSPPEVAEIRLGAGVEDGETIETPGEKVVENGQESEASADNSDEDDDDAIADEEEKGEEDTEGKAFNFGLNDGRLPEPVQLLIQRATEETGWKGRVREDWEAYNATMDIIFKGLNVPTTNINMSDYTSKVNNVARWLKAIKNFAYKIHNKKQPGSSSKRKSMAIEDMEEGSISSSLVLLQANVPISGRTRNGKRARITYNSASEEVGDDTQDSNGSRNEENHNDKLDCGDDAPWPYKLRLKEMQHNANQLQSETETRAVLGRFDMAATFQEEALKRIAEMAKQTQESFIKFVEQAPDTLTALSANSEVRSALENFVMTPKEFHAFADKCAERLMTRC